MKILVTGAKGFVGKNLCAALKNLKEGKDKARPALSIEEIFEYDIDSNPADLETYCKQADFVFNLAGVNRPQTQEEFMQGNFGFASTLLDTLKKYNNKCPVMLSSSIQATLIGRYADGEYGKSKKAKLYIPFVVFLLVAIVPWRVRIRIRKIPNPFKRQLGGSGFVFCWLVR